MEWSWTPLKTFAQSRPVLYGVPTAAFLGIVLGMAFRVGPQVDTSTTTEPFSRASVEDNAVPIAWPSGKVPDYVVGTDFLAETRRPEPIYVAQTDYVGESEYYAAAAKPLPAPPVAEPAPVVIAARAAGDETRWASARGDILDLTLPEDAVAAPSSRD